MFLQGDLTEKQRKSLYYFLLLIVFLWHLPCMTVFLPGEDSLDSSWQKTLFYAARNQIFFGKEFIFTYGPLGYLLYPMSKLYYLFAALLNILFLFALKELFLFQDKREFLWKALFVLLTLCSTLHDLFLLFLPFILWENAGRKPDKKNICFLSFCVLTGAITVFMKFTYFPVILFSCIFADIRMLVREKKCFLLGAFLLFLPLIWLLIGQNMGQLGNFFLYSFEIMDGFNKAMGYFQGRIEYFFLAVMLVCFLLCVVIFQLYEKKEELSLTEKILFFLAASLPLYVSYKYIAVRMDAGHIAGGLINMAVLAAYFLCEKMPENPGKRQWLIRITLLAVFCGIMGIVMTKQLPRLPGELLKKAAFGNIVSVFQKQGENVFGENEERAEKKSCDLFACGEFDFLHKMGFAYKPRPVMQSYSAYTEKLLYLNRTHTAEASSDFLLFRLENLDRRFPMLADYSILPLCNKYVPEKVSEGNNGTLLLMKKNLSGKERKLKKIREEKLAAGKEFTLLAQEKDKLYYASFHFEYSLLGKMVSFLWRVPPPVLHFTLKGEKNQEKDLIFSMTRSPFLFSPVLETTEEFSYLWDRQKGKVLAEKKAMKRFTVVFTARLFSREKCALDEFIGKLLYKDTILFQYFETSFPGK